MLLNSFRVQEHFLSGRTSRASLQDYKGAFFNNKACSACVTASTRNHFRLASKPAAWTASITAAWSTLPSTVARPA